MRDIGAGGADGSSDGPADFWPRYGVADAPAGHGIAFRERVGADDAPIVAQRRRADMLALVDQFVIGFVADEIEVVALYEIDDLFQQRLREDRAGGIGGTVDDDGFGARRHQTL